MGRRVRSTVWEVREGGKSQKNNARPRSVVFHPNRTSWNWWDRLIITCQTSFYFRYGLDGISVNLSSCYLPSLPPYFSPFLKLPRTRLLIIFLPSSPPSFYIISGTPYMLFKDACNAKSNQQNLGTIRSSNLCTEIVEYTAPDEVGYWLYHRCLRLFKMRYPLRVCLLLLNHMMSYPVPSSSPFFTVPFSRLEHTKH